MGRSAAVATLLFAVVACGGGSSAADCSPAFQEQRDPASDLHILTGEEAEYLTDPPTSGPHAAISLSRSVLDDPLSRSHQVSVLEAGRILVQYSDAVGADAIVRLQALADDTIVVAPNPGLDDPVVVTAWTWKMVCSGTGPDAIAAIGDFAERRASAAPGSDL